MRPSLGPILKILLQTLLPIAVLAGVAALLVGGWVGAGIALAALGTVCVYQGVRLARLADWLDQLQTTSPPDEPGLWGEVIAKIYRLAKTQQRIQSELTMSLSELRQAISALPDGVVILDAEKRIEWCNPAAEQQWHISLAQDEGQIITALVRFPEFVRHMQQHDKTNPLVLRLSADCILWIRLLGFGERQTLLLSRDIAEREKTDLMRRDFVANVSHEMRTPLTVLLGFLETLTDAPNNESGHDAAVVQTSLRHMEQQALRMRQLVDDLLTLSRLEDSYHPLATTSVNMPALIRAAVNDAERLSAGRHRLKVDAETLWVEGNESELSSALLNLVSNAVRYTPTGSEIEVVWKRDGEHLVLKVRDNGEGIAPEHLPRLTERFYRVDRGRSRAEGGTGLGLSIVRHVALRHGAELTIHSSQAAYDHGSEFAIVFPASRERVAGGIG